MGKLKPSILTGMFSHLSMGKKKKSEYEDLRQISPKSKVKQKTRSRSMISTLSSKLDKVKPKKKNKMLLAPSTSNTPVKKNSAGKVLKSNVQKMLRNSKNVFAASSNQYNEITESPIQPPRAASKREKFKNSKASSLRERMVKRLKAARFR